MGLRVEILQFGEQNINLYPLQNQMRKQHQKLCFLDVHTFLVNNILLLYYIADLAGKKKHYYKKKFFSQCSLYRRRNYFNHT